MAFVMVFAIFLVAAAMTRHAVLEVGDTFLQVFVAYIGPGMCMATATGVGMVVLTGVTGLATGLEVTVEPEQWSRRRTMAIGQSDFTRQDTGSSDRTGPRKSRGA